MTKLIPKIILEGTRLTHKTDLAFALNEHPRIVGPRKYRYHSPIISGEWGAFSNHPWGQGIINFEQDQEKMALETYQTWLRLFQLQRYYSWIVDRFHISTQVFQALQFGRNYDFSWLEEGLKELDFRIIHCFRKPESFSTAREKRLAISGNPKQYDDLELFINEQEHFFDAIMSSSLNNLAVDMTKGDIDQAANEIADWLESTGGLSKED